MKEQEKRFLEKLGITPGPWEYIDNYVKGIFNPGGECPAHVKDKTHGDFISKAPEMFLSLFKTTKKNVEIGCPKCAHKFPEKNCDKCDKMEQVKTLESATGKTFQELCEIWESCAE